MAVDINVQCWCRCWERKVEELVFFVMTVSAVQLTFLYSFATKLSPYLEKGSSVLHEMTNSYSEVKCIVLYCIVFIYIP